MQKWIIIIFVTVVALFAGLQFLNRQPSATAPNSVVPTATQLISPSPSPVINVNINDVPKEMTVEGEYVCLQPKESNEPQTRECALGLKLHDDTYIAADFGDLLNTNKNMKFQTGSMLRVTGLYVPVEQLNTDMWRKYTIKGIMKVSNAVQL